MAITKRGVASARTTSRHGIAGNDYTAATRDGLWARRNAPAPPRRSVEPRLLAADLVGVSGLGPGNRSPLDPRPVRVELVHRAIVADHYEEGAHHHRCHRLPRHRRTPCRLVKMSCCAVIRVRDTDYGA